MHAEEAEQRPAAGNARAYVSRSRAGSRARHSAAPRAALHDGATSEHVVQFYESDEFLVARLSQFVQEGLQVAEACVVIATPAHLAHLTQRLQAAGMDPQADSLRDVYAAVETGAVLPRIMNDGMPDADRFARIVGGMIGQAAGSGRGVRVFGEMVAELWDEGNHAAAIRLEELWNELRDHPHPFSLWCAYPMASVAGVAHDAGFAEICARHTRVLPGETYNTLTSAEDRLRAITALQQKARSLEAEIALRKVVEERLRVSENRYRQIFETSTDGILVVDPITGTVSDANPVMTALLGEPRAHLLGRGLWQIGVFPDGDAAATFLRQVEEAHSVHYPRLTLRARDGQRFAELNSTCFRVNGHKVIQCNLRDITDRIQAEEALRESSERMRLMAESMPQKVFTARADGVLDYLNPQWMEFTGLAFEELQGWGWLRIIHPDDAEANERDWRHSLATGEPLYCEQRLRRSDGTYRWHLSRAIPLRDSDGAITMWVGSSSDIDEQKQLEVRKNAFVSMASHELKTPVTSLKGFTQVLQRRLRRSADPQTLLFLDRMDEQLTRLTRLIGDLLDVSKMETGVLAFQQTRFELDALVSETMENVQAATSTHQLRIEGETQATIWGDRDRLGQVMINLLVNAIKYSPQAELVSVRLKHKGEYAEVAVQDYGIGIAPEYQARIFDQFYQIAQPRESTYPGLGIGLYIARTLVERHGGRLWLESSEGGGSTFYFTLPLAPRERRVKPLLQAEVEAR